VEPKHELPQGSLPARISIVTHEMGCALMVKNPGEHVRRIHDSRKMNQDDVLNEAPVLKCKMPDFDVSPNS